MYNASVVQQIRWQSTRGRSLFAYQRAGIPYYWIIDPEHETLTDYRVTPEGYVVHLTAGKRETVRAAPFEDLELAVALLFGD